MRGCAATVFALSPLAAPAVSACTTCRPAVQAGIFDERFWGLLVVAVLYRARPQPLPGEEQPG